MADKAKWYVVHTYSGYENKVATNLEKIRENRGMEDRILDIRIPMETVTEIKDDKIVEVERKLFPSYVLINMVMDDETWYVVRNTRGVTGFVGPGSKPVPLSDAEIAALGVEKKETAINFAVGDSVNITAGPFDGFVGEVTAIDAENGLVTVNVSMFGRDTPVELELSQIKAAD